MVERATEEEDFQTRQWEKNCFLCLFSLSFAYRKKKCSSKFATNERRKMSSDFVNFKTARIRSRKKKHSVENAKWNVAKASASKIMQFGMSIWIFSAPKKWFAIIPFMLARLRLFASLHRREMTRALFSMYVEGVKLWLTRSRNRFSLRNER